MTSILVDEDLPRSLARELSARGHTALDVRDVGLRGKADEQVLAEAMRTRSVLVTGDVGFGNTLAYPLGQHSGIVLVRLPELLPAATRVRLVVGALSSLSAEDLDGNLVVIEPGRIRIRRKP